MRSGDSAERGGDKAWRDSRRSCRTASQGGRPALAGAGRRRQRRADRARTRRAPSPRRLPEHALDGVLVSQVCLDSAEPVGVVELDADVIVKRADRHVVDCEQFLGVEKNGEALFTIGLASSGGDQLIETRVAPTGAIIPVSRDKAAEEGVGVLVIANP